MVLRRPHDDRSRRQLITFSQKRRPAKLGHTVQVSTQGKDRTMLNAVLGMLAMVPVAFGVAGYTMVSR
jgi:hypothetical protein